MKLPGKFLVGLVTLATMQLRAEDPLDRVEEALTFSAFQDQVRARASGLIDLEGYYFQKPAPGLIYSSGDSLYNPRFTFFVDAQFGEHVYFFTQARVDRGFDPSDGPLEARMDEYALRLAPWDDGRLSFQVGKYATVIGNWVPRHLSWENPFVLAPLPYGTITPVTDYAAPGSPHDFFYVHEAGKYEYNPLIWGPDYATGASVAGRFGRVDYAAEIKNSSLSARPESWDATSVGFSHPTFSGRLGYRPNTMWNFGLSGSEGPYFTREAASTLPAGTGLGDYREFVLGQDMSFAWHHLQLWAEFFEGRFEVPRIGNADLFSYYLEAKYKLAPQLFGALRWNQQLYAEVSNGYGGNTPWGRDLWRTDAALGYRITAHTQLKIQYSLQHEDTRERDLQHIAAAQFTLRW